MRKVKKIARFIVELVLTILIVSFVLINIISSTILSKSYVLASIEKTNYYDQIYELLKTNFENYIQQSGLDEKVIENIVSKENVKEDTKKIIVNMYDDFYEEISIDHLKTKLENNINESLNNRVLTEKEKKDIDDFINEICEEYKSTISSLDFQKQVNNEYRKIMKTINSIKKIIIIGIGILVVFIILLNLKRIYKIGTNIGISCLSSGIIMLVINFYINAKVDVQYISILNEPISNVIRNIASDVLGSVCRSGILFTIIGVGLIIGSSVTHNVIRYKNILSDEPKD